jgi:hypothetical protein
MATTWLVTGQPPEFNSMVKSKKLHNNYSKDYVSMLSVYYSPLHKG